MRSNAPLTLPTLVLTSAGAPAAQAQTFATETIYAIATWDVPWEGFFANEFDLIHQKELRFEGIATVGGDPSIPLPATVWVQFDWLDPIAGVVYSPAWGFPVAYTPATTPIDVSWIIDFCPQQVSLHFATDTPDGGVVNIAGVFMHECIPEPGSFALVSVLGLIGFAVWRRTGRSGAA